VKAAVEETQRPLLFGDGLSLASFKMGAYVGFGAFGYVRIVSRRSAS
jgi:hypothetical protein